MGRAIVRVGEPAVAARLVRPRLVAAFEGEVLHSVALVTELFGGDVVGRGRLGVEVLGFLEPVFLLEQLQGFVYLAGDPTGGRANRLRPGGEDERDHLDLIAGRFGGEFYSHIGLRHVLRNGNLPDGQVPGGHEAHRREHQQNYSYGYRDDVHHRKRKDYSEERAEAHKLGETGVAAGENVREARRDQQHRRQDAEHVSPDAVVYGEIRPYDPGYACQRRDKRPQRRGCGAGWFALFGIGFFYQDSTFPCLSSAGYSYCTASTIFVRAAERAGNNPAKIPIPSPAKRA